MMDALGIACDLGADHAGRIALQLGTTHPADRGIIDYLDIEGAGRRTIVRTGGMPDIDLGVLVHAPIGIIKRWASRAHLSVMGCVKRELAMRYGLKRRLPLGRPGPDFLTSKSDDATIRTTREHRRKRMARRLIDISVPLQNGVPADPPGIRPTIQYNDHQRSLPQMLGFFEGLRAEDLPDGQGWAMETVQLSTHNGTHLDAPWHYHPTMNRGERSWTIDEVPLEWCLQPGVKLDFRHFADGYVVTAGDVETELKRIGHTLSPLRSW
jgi:hypothetical protein